jgi:transcriptional regulator with GAF, ATPase, and Fis domain
MTIEVSQDTASVLSGLSRTLATDRTVDTTLAAIVGSAGRLLPGVRAVGISCLAADRRVMARAQSDPLVTSLDDLQTELQQGPCMQVLVNGEDRVRADDLRTDPRWPAFAHHALDQGISSVCSSRLFIDRATLGVLSLFAEEPGAFDETTATTCELLAAHAAVALGAVQREDQFNEAVRRRDVIGQAKGVLMSRHGVDEDTAFTTLVRFSQSQNLKLHEVAVRLMSTVTAAPPC